MKLLTKYLMLLLYDKKYSKSITHLSRRVTYCAKKGLCGGSNPDTDPQRCDERCSLRKWICKIAKFLVSENNPKMPRHLGAGEISRNFRFSCVLVRFLCMHVHTLMMCCVADFGVCRFCRGETNPLAMLGVKSISVLPDF